MLDRTSPQDEKKPRGGLLLINEGRSALLQFSSTSRLYPWKVANRNFGEISEGCQPRDRLAPHPK